MPLLAIDTIFTTEYVLFIFTTIVAMITIRQSRRFTIRSTLLAILRCHTLIAADDIAFDSRHG